jgi:hypothetical protein
LGLFSARHPKSGPIYFVLNTLQKVWWGGGILSLATGESLNDPIVDAHSCPPGSDFNQDATLNTEGRHLIYASTPAMSCNTFRVQVNSFARRLQQSIGPHYPVAEQSCNETHPASKNYINKPMHHCYPQVVVLIRSESIDTSLRIASNGTRGDATLVAAELQHPVVGLRYVNLLDL